MSSEPIPLPPIDEQAEGETLRTPLSSPVSTQQTVEAIERPYIDFSFVQWASKGAIRLSYRAWTRIAARLFPEDSRSEALARSWHIPLPDKLNLSWVNSHLAVGGRVRPEDIKALGHAGITHVVDTRSEYCDDGQALAQENIELLHLPAPDTYPLSIEQLMEGALWVHERIERGGRVLIHCEHGVGRSVLLTGAVLVYGGSHARDALHLIQQKRWQAAPNHRQILRLKEFEAALDSLRNA